MDSNCTNAGVSIYFQCRKYAAKYNPELESRERAAEYLGVSVSSLANYELGITVVPVDVVMRMADLYNAPQLRNLFCKKECPLGKDRTLAVEVKSLEAVTIGILSMLDTDEVKVMKQELLKIAEDGKVSPDEMDEFEEIVVSLDRVSLAISELKLLAKKYRMESSDLMDVKKTEEYLKSEFGIGSLEELEEAVQKTGDIDIGLFVTPLFGSKQWEIA